MTDKQKIFTSDMEKDSYFSDTSSGYFSGVEQAEYKDLLFSSSPAKNLQSCPEEPVVPGSYKGVSSMYLIDNVLLQQSNSKTPTLKPWVYKSQKGVSPSPLVLFQPVIHGGNCTSQTPTTEQRQFKNVTALNSSLNIDSFAEDPNRGYDGRHRRHRHGEKRRLCKSSSTSNTSPDHFKHSTESVDIQNFLTCLPPIQTPGLTSSESSLGSDIYSSTYPGDAKQDYAFSDDSDNVSEAFSPCSSKRKRFCNTYNILNQSGLLGITLRTKELIQENQRSQAQLQKLHAHTDLFLEALRSEDPQVWTKLQLMFKNNTTEE